MSDIAVIFDLDGTLVDSWRHHVRCLQATLADLGLAIPSPLALRVRQAATDRDTLIRLAGPDRAAEALRRYERYATDRSADVRAVSGAQETLHNLAQQGIQTGVCTGRSRELARFLLRRAGIDVALFVAADEVTAAKPDPEGLTRAATLAGVELTRLRYVGDSEFDAQQGVAAGVSTFIVGPAAATIAARWPVVALPRLRELPDHLAVKDTA